MEMQNPREKTGGRKKGTPNKKTQLLAEILEVNDFSIPEKIIELLPSLAPKKQADVLLDLMSYMYPKRKAVEQTSISANLHAHSINIEKLNHQDLTELHRATTQKMFGYDPDNAEERRLRMEQLMSMHNTLNDGKSVRIVPKK